MKIVVLLFLSSFYLLIGSGIIILRSKTYNRHALLTMFTSMVLFILGAVALDSTTLS